MFGDFEFFPCGLLCWMFASWMLRLVASASVGSGGVFALHCVFLFWGSGFRCVDIEFCFGVVRVHSFFASFLFLGC